ncbi:hypothetical protein [Nocardia brasiliensis]|uniref:hypothetical protein n=1 Tax=Nocardia brasiliensis TaxID=37326 RepID=UPI003D8D117D
MVIDLERRGMDRQLEGLPSEAELDRRATIGHGFTSPELANLMAHVKLTLKADLLAGDLPDDPDFAAVLPEYFPVGVRTRFAEAIPRHRLRREIITTMVVNDVIDNAGISYPFRLAEQLDSTGADAVRAYSAAVTILELRPLWAELRACPMPIAARDALEFEVGATLERLARWLLLSCGHPREISACAAGYRSGLARLTAVADQWQPACMRADTACRAEQSRRTGAPSDLAERVFGLAHLVPLLDVLDLAEDCGREPEQVAALYYSLRHELRIDRILRTVEELEHGDRWGALARLAVRDDLHDSMRLLSLDVLTSVEPGLDTAATIADWAARNRSRLTRAENAFAEILAAPEPGLETLSVATRQIRALVLKRGR